jgi:murein L,D-transpeptidase YafK
VLDLLCARSAGAKVARNRIRRQGYFSFFCVFSSGLFFTHESLGKGTCFALFLSLSIRYLSPVTLSKTLWLYTGIGLVILIGVVVWRKFDLLALLSPSTLLKPAGAAVTAPPGPLRARAAAERVLPLLQNSLSALGLKAGDPVFLRAFKEEGILELWMRPSGASRFVLFQSYPIAAQSGELGPKLLEGDGQVPEGFYQVSRSAMKPDSRFHLAFNIGYPNAYDRAHDRTGSFIMIHGSFVSIGCLAMTDEKIEEIYTLCDAALTAGQNRFDVHMFPFRMSSERMENAQDSPHFAFWQNLQEGHRIFNEQGVPPDVSIREKRYHFSPSAPVE